MQHIEESDVAGENGDRSQDILMAKIDIPIASRRDATALFDFSSVEIEPEDWLPAPALTQVKREQTQPAAYVQNWFVRTVKQFAGGGINGIASQFARHVTAKPKLPE